MVSIKNEAEFSKNMIKAILRQGVYAYKTSDRMQFGIPDVYISGGNWIENKLGPMPRRKPVAPLKWFDGWQINRLNAFQKSGDNCFAGIYWRNMRDTNYMTIMRWEHFKYVKNWNDNIIIALSFPIAPGMDNLPMGFLFGQSHERNVTFTHCDMVWAKFQEDFADHVREDDPTVKNREMGIMFPGQEGEDNVIYTESDFEGTDQPS